MPMDSELSIAGHFSLVSSTGDPHATAAFAEANLWDLFNTCYGLLVETISTLPSKVITHYPALQLLHPLIPPSVRATHLIQTVQFEKYRASKSVDPLLALSLKIFALRINGQISEALRLSLTLQQQLHCNPLAAGTSQNSPLWFYHHQIGSTMLMAGNTIDALCEFTTARQLGQDIGSNDAVYSCLARETLIHAMRGSHLEARQGLESLDELPEPSSAYLSAAQGSITCARALISCQNMDDNLEALLNELSPLNAVDVVWPVLLLIRTRSALAKNQAADVLESISIAATAHRMDAQCLAFDIAAASQIEAHLLLSNLEKASQLAERSSAEGVYTRIALVRMDIVRGEYKLARSAAKTLSGSLRLSTYHRNELLLLIAWADYLQVGKVSELSAQLISPLFCEENRGLLAQFPVRFLSKIAAASGPAAAQRFESVTRGLEFRQPLRQVPHLTDAELRVLQHLLVENTRAQTASLLQISPNTLKTQLRLLYRKLGAASREEAIVNALQLGLISE